MTLKTICQNALEEIGGFDVPDSFIDNVDLTAKQCVALVNREGRNLIREYRWTELISTHTFTTVASQANYALPSDFRAFSNMSGWDRTNQLPMIGPNSGATWQWLQSGITNQGATISRWWRVEDNDFFIYPTPEDTGSEIAYDYYSNGWVLKQIDSTYTNKFTADNDTGRLDEELITMGLKWRFLQAKGMPFEAEYKEYEAIKEELIADNGGKPNIRLGYNPIVYTHLPDTGYGGTGN